MSQRSYDLPAELYVDGNLVGDIATISLSFKYPRVLIDAMNMGFDVPISALKPRYDRIEITTTNPTSGEV